MLGLTILLFGSGCMGRSSAVRALAPADIGQIRARGITAVYFVPFDASSVVLKGDHGDGPTAEQNKGKWFSHVVAGAQLALNEDKDGTAAVLVTPVQNPYDREVMDKLKVRINYSPGIPLGAVVVSGRYLVSDNVSGGSRAMLGAMVGNTYTRAQIRVMRGNAIVFDATLDGTYLGGGFSWGYETLGANEALGRIIVEVIQKLQRGEHIDIESAKLQVPNAGRSRRAASHQPSFEQSEIDGIGDRL
jgi:hypothetical protein